MPKVTREQIENVLWDNGVTANFTGFSYLVDILLLAEDGEPINQDIITKAAQVHGRSRQSVYQAVKKALMPLHLKKRFEEDRSVKPFTFLSQSVYYDIRTLHQALH